MPQPRYNPFEKIVDYQKKQIQNSENSARLAHSFGQFTTTGWGEFYFEDCIEFESPYLYRPTVMPGHSLFDEDEAEKIRSTRFPRCSGVVARWDIKGGLYYGAWVVVTVEDRSPFIAPTDPDVDPNYKIVHDFTFLGTATKRIPSPTNGDDNGAK